MENRRNYYRILQVQPGAPVEIIRASYRTLMQRLKAHPDLGGDHAQAALINEAYAVLTDPAQRAAYDRDFHARVLDARGSGAAGTGQCLFCHAPHATPVAPRALCAACGSPLHPLGQRQLAADGRRAINRLPRRFPVTIYASWPQPAGFAGEARDVSPNGLSFVTTELLVPAAVVKLDSEACRAVVTVANTRVEDDGRDGLWLIGAEFLSVLFARTRGGFLSARA